MKTVGLIVASKPLLSYKNSTTVENYIQILKKAEVDLIVVVIGSNNEQTEILLKNKDVVIVYNPDTTASDLMSYVRAGIKKILHIQNEEQREEIPYEALFLLQGDALTITPSVLVKEQLLMKYCDAKILFPTFQGKKIYLPLIRFNILQDICDYNGGDGLKGALEQFEEETAYMEVDDYESTQVIETSAKYSCK